MSPAPTRGRSTRAARPRPNMWPRRIITGSGLLLVVALLVWGLFSLIGLLSAGPSGASEDARPQSAAPVARETVQSGADTVRLGAGDRVTKDGIVSDNDVTTIPGCPDSALSYTADVSQTSVGAGENVSVTIVNNGNVACRTALGRLAMKVLTGEQTVYDSAACESRDENAKPLLLIPGEPWTGSIAWDGRVYDSGCTAPDAGAPLAAAGTYRAILSVAGEPVVPEWVFTLVEAAPAQP